jgi:UDP-N-acetylglucosamine--N-acetylmuramyl-(pentapeptide) pyrophosphoryl-undecaprenol N-acetylglucosamine transferase
MLKIPISLHDGNSYIGKANIMLSRFAKNIALAFPPKNSLKLKCPYVVTGMPLRPELAPKSIEQQYGNSLIEAFNKAFKADFKPEKNTVLVFGGSQGAATFNSVIPEVFKIMEKDDFQIIHISGAGNKETLNNAYQGIKNSYIIFETCDTMGLLYAVADLVICRAGGSTVAELALFGKSAILIPYPYATDDHQTVNAEYYIAAENSIIINDADVLPEPFAEVIIDWVENKNNYLERVEKARALAHPDAADEVLDMIISSI